MKVRDCKKCRADIFKAAKDEYLNHEFDIFEDSARSLAIYRAGLQNISQSYMMTW